MVETEMSLQSELVKSNKPDLISSYSKIEVKDDDSDVIINSQVINNPNQNLSELIPKENITMINSPIYSVNSDQIRPITHKYFYSKLGNTHTFFADENGNPLIIIGPHWPLAAVVIICFTILFFGIMIYFRKYITTSNTIMGYSIYFCFIIFYLLTALLNPGYPFQDENSLINKSKTLIGYCTVCKIWLDLDKKVKHCNFCNICIEGMDHHCPWTGKCIGRKNLIPFYFFVLFVFGFMSYCAVIIIKCKSELNKSLKK